MMSPHSFAGVIPFFNHTIDVLHNTPHSCLYCSPISRHMGERRYQMKVMVTQIRQQIHIQLFQKRLKTRLRETSLIVEPPRKEMDTRQFALKIANHLSTDEVPVFISTIIEMLVGMYSASEMCRAINRSGYSLKRMLYPKFWADQ